VTASLVVAAALSLPFIAVLATRPVERRLALRYPLRRPVEALLVILGSLLGTAIITGSLVVGDTIDRSIRASAYDQLGPIDELLGVSGLSEGDTLVARFDGFESPDVDGMLRINAAPAAARGSFGQPRAQILEVDFDAARAFGDDPALAGATGDTPQPGHTVITKDLAVRTGVAAGGELDVFAFGQTLTLTVDRIVERRGVMGFWPLDQRQQSYNAFVAPGTLAELTAPVTGARGVEPPTTYLAFSNVGGVEGGAVRTDAATEAIERRVEGTEVHVQKVKQDRLRSADDTASALTDLYFTMGMFAVSAGILLLVNIFVMLADERRSELGMLRALGLRRLPLVRAFATEGWLYSVAASLLGAFAGIQVGRVIAWRADSILSGGDEIFSLNLLFAYKWSTVARGFVIGFVVSLMTIVVTSIRVSRLNVIAAIRDLPAIRRRRVRRRWARAGVILVGIGVAWTVLAVSTVDAYGVMIGPAFVIIGVGPSLARRIAVRAALAVTAAALLIWGTLTIPVLGVLDVDVTIPVFLVQGLMMAGAAVAIVSVYQGRIARLLGRATGGSIPVRLGLSHPIERRFRTAMTLGMFAIVVLTLVYLSVISFMFRNHVDTISEEAGGGFNVIVTANPTNPVTLDQLASTPGVQSVAPLAYGQASFVVPGDDPVTWPVTGFGPELLRSPPAMQELGAYASESDAWQAVLEDPDLVIVDEFFLATGGGPSSSVLEVGDTLDITDPVNGGARTLTVAALAENDFVNSGAWFGLDGYRDVFGARAVYSRFYLAADDPTGVATRIRAEHIANGADAEAVRDHVDAIVAQNTGFFTLMQQFVGVGLIVGIAGIGVLLVRAVRERRREIGVLRALGFQVRAVSRALLVEGGFIAVEGVTIGVVVALVSSYGLVTSGNNFAEGFAWGVPWREVAGIVAVAVVTSTLIALWPARRASQIRPAVALRTAD
jgi:putative ABC transport system permease protein